MNLISRLALLVCIATIPAVAIQGYNVLKLRADREAEVREEAQRLAVSAAAEIDRILHATGLMLGSLLESPAVLAGDAAACSAHVGALERRFPEYVRIAVADALGEIQCYSPGSTARPNLAARSYFGEALARDGLVVGEHQTGARSGRGVLPIAVRAGNPARPERVAVAALDLEWLSRYLERRSLPEGGSVTVADRGGTIIARTPFADRFIGTRIPDAFRGLLTAAAAGSTEILSQDGTRRILGYVPLGAPPAGLYVSAGLSTQAAFASIDAATRNGLLLLVAGWGIALLAAVAGGHAFLRRPLSRLLRAGEAWRDGDYGTRAGLSSGPTEIVALSVAFDGMAAAVERREAALRESEQRFRSMADGAPALIWVTDEKGLVTFANRRYEDLFARPAREMAGNGWRLVVHPDDVERFHAGFRAAFAALRPFRDDVRVFDRDGRERWFRCEGVPRFEGGPDGGPDGGTGGGTFLGYVGCNVDVTEAKRSEELRTLLVNELNHRVKNSLATARALVAQTLRSASDMDEAREAVSARIAALARAHDILTAEDWKGADVERIVADAVEPHAAGEGRFALGGPPVRLAPKPALSLAMALQELCTNAAKHGALSTGEGRVSVDWTREEAPPRLVLRWVETGGPPVEPPSRKGFGSRLLERGVALEAGGRVELLFERPGVTCTIEIPLGGEAGGTVSVPEETTA